jgi:hypothetical protein
MQLLLCFRDQFLTPFPNRASRQLPGALVVVDLDSQLLKVMMRFHGDLHRGNYRVISGRASRESAQKSSRKTLAKPFGNLYE